MEIHIFPTFSYEARNGKFSLPHLEPIREVRINIRGVDTERRVAPPLSLPLQGTDGIHGIVIYVAGNTPHVVLPSHAACSSSPLSL